MWVFWVLFSGHLCLSSVWCCRRGCSSSLMPVLWCGSRPSSLGNLPSTIYTVSFFSHPGSFRRLLDTKRSFPLRNNIHTCPPPFSATSLSLYLLFHRKTFFKMLSECTASAHSSPSEQPGFWLLAWWHPPHDPHLGGQWSSIAQSNGEFCSHTWFLSIGTADQSPIFRNLISFFFLTQHFLGYLPLRAAFLLVSNILELCNTLVLLVFIPLSLSERMIRQFVYSFNNF